MLSWRSEVCQFEPDSSSSCWLKLSHSLSLSRSLLWFCQTRVEHGLLPGRILDSSLIDKHNFRLPPRVLANGVRAGAPQAQASRHCLVSASTLQSGLPGSFLARLALSLGPRPRASIKATAKTFDENKFMTRAVHFCEAGRWRGSGRAGGPAKNVPDMEDALWAVSALTTPSRADLWGLRTSGTSLPDLYTSMWNTICV